MTRAPANLRPSPKGSGRWSAPKPGEAPSSCRSMRVRELIVDLGRAPDFYYNGRAGEPRTERRPSEGLAGRRRVLTKGIRLIERARRVLVSGRRVARCTLWSSRRRRRLQQLGPKLVYCFWGRCQILFYVPIVNCSGPKANGNNKRLQMARVRLSDAGPLGFISSVSRPD